MNLTEDGLCLEHGKVPFNIQQVKEIRKAKKEGAWYKCPHCDGYHITSLSFKGRKKRLNKKADKSKEIHIPVLPKKDVPVRPSSAAAKQTIKRMKEQLSGSQ